MHFSMKFALAASSMSAMTGFVYGHMILQFPVPFGSPDNSPLQASGADFPCKQGPNVYKMNTMNELKVGTSYELTFSGSADHGGGSCQFLVTLDKEPTKASTWKKIHVVEGACPVANGKFPFAVPPEVPNGFATFGIGWFSRQAGAPELYMNCAPITVSGGASDDSQFKQLPDAEFANIQPFAQTCKVPANMAATFENPGKYSTRIGPGPYADVCGRKAAGGGEGGGVRAPTQTPNNGQYTRAPAVPSQAPITSQPPVSSQAPASGIPVITSTIHKLMTVTAPVSAALSSIPTAPPAVSHSAGGSSYAAPVVPVPPTTPSAAPSAPSSPASPGGGGVAGGAGTCSQEGAVVCNGEEQFGLCNHGKVVFQPVAAGTKCQNGQIAKREFTHRLQRTRIN